jgi:hypothetical protein
MYIWITRKRLELAGTLYERRMISLRNGIRSSKIIGKTSASATLDLVGAEQLFVFGNFKGSIVSFSMFPLIILKLFDIPDS